MTHRHEGPLVAPVVTFEGLLDPKRQATNFVFLIAVPYQNHLMNYYSYEQALVAANVLENYLLVLLAAGNLNFFSGHCSYNACNGDPPETLGL
jgi:hypothetical protein